MAELARLTFPDLVSLAIASSNVSAACACSSHTLRSWQSVPLALADTDFRDVGTLLEDPGWLDNDGVNFVNTLTGAGLALLWAHLLALA